MVENLDAIEEIFAKKNPLSRGSTIVHRAQSLGFHSSDFWFWAVRSNMASYE